jgi:hypothetical protein
VDRSWRLWPGFNPCRDISSENLASGAISALLIYVSIPAATSPPKTYPAPTQLNASLRSAFQSLPRHLLRKPPTAADGERFDPTRLGAIVSIPAATSPPKTGGSLPHSPIERKETQVRFNPCRDISSENR